MLNLSSIDGSEPSSKIVTLDEAKDQCYIARSNTDTTVEALLTFFLTVAREKAEAITWRSVIESTYTLYLDEFPTGIIDLRRPPIIDVASVKYRDADDTLQTWAASNYQVDTISEPGRIRPVSGTRWPATYDRLNAVQIEYTAGYDESDQQHTLPAAIKQGILMLVKHYYDNRDAVVVGQRSSVDAIEIPFGISGLLASESAREFV